MYGSIALLMIGVLVLQGLVALGWGLGIQAMDMPRRPGLHWLLSAVLCAAAIGLMLLRDQLPLAWRLPPAAVMMSAQVLLLVRGMRIFLDLPLRDGQTLLLLAQVTLAAVASGLQLDMGRLSGVAAQAWSISLLMVWLFGSVLVQAWPRLVDEFGGVAARVLALPLLLSAGLGLLRMSSLLLGPPQPVSFDTTPHALVAMLILVVTTTLHGAMAAMVILRLVRRLRESSQRDALTGLNNRGEWMRQLGVQQRLLQRRGRPLAVLLLDIDHFKRVNDGHGHAAGDEVLVGIAQTLRLASRDADVVGRLGGEEFALLLPDCELPSALRLAERLRHAVQQTRIVWHGRQLQVSTSIGVAVADSADEDLTKLLERADAALYRAKHAGRNRVEAAAEAAAVATAVLSAAAAAGSPGARAPSAIPTP